MKQSAEDWPLVRQLQKIGLFELGRRAQIQDPIQNIDFLKQIELKKQLLEHGWGAQIQDPVQKTIEEEEKEKEKEKEGEEEKEEGTRRGGGEEGQEVFHLCI